MALEALITASAHGDARAYKTIYDMLSGRVFRYIRARTANRPDALDVLQETFIDFWKALPAFRYEDDAKAEAFIYTIASRKLARYYRFRRAHVDIEDIEMVDPRQDDNARYATFDVLRTLGSLPAPEQEIIRLRYMADIPWKEIAQILGQSENALKVRHHRAIARLKKLLGYE